MKLRDQILWELRQIETYLEDGCDTIAGHNGLYHDEETPVRNLSHWLFLVSECKLRHDDYKIESQFIDNLKQRILDCLLKDEFRPLNQAFWVRKNPKKDFCNGTIGQAWVIEALVRASIAFAEPGLYKIAEDLFCKHPFHDDLGVWGRLNVDGTHSTPDPVFNHQLWMAAAASQLDKTDLARQRASLFLDNVASNVKLYHDGIICHLSPVMKMPHKSSDKRLKVEAVLNYIFYVMSRHEQKYKSAGYHAFNLYAFALMHEAFPNHTFWTTRKFRKMIEVTRTAKFKKLNIANPYSYPYNPTGIEMAFVLETFVPNSEHEIGDWLRLQLSETHVPDDSIMTRQSKDAMTSRARIYEAVRLQSDYSLI